MSEGYLRFWGVRGSYPAPFDTHLKVGGNTSCVEIRVDDDIVICDAGTGIIALGNELMATSPPRRLEVLLSHYHWDHISGLPFFVPAFVRGWQVRMHGPGANAGEVERNISAQMKAPYFPVETETWLASVQYEAPGREGFDLGPVHVQPFNVHHPGSTFGYRIETCGKTIVYASDNELGFIDRSIDDRKHEFDDEEQALLDEMKDAERARSLEFLRGVDILIHDAQYTPADYVRKRGWGHSCYVDTVNAAVEAGVGELYLFHVDPNYDDDTMHALLTHSRELIAESGSGLGCHLACEGERIAL